MLHVPAGPQFQFVASDFLNTRPSSTFGAAITASATPDTYGSYVEILSDANLTEDCYGLLLNFNVGFSTGALRSGTITIGKDEAGGTSYTDWLTHIVAGQAGNYHQTAGAKWLYFPLYIKAGTALAAKYANATGSATIRCYAAAYGRPKYPQAVRAGTKFETFGASAGNGTAITSGAASEGAWTQLGSNPASNLWWWQYGFQSDDTTMNALIYHFDLARGDASNKHIIFEGGVIRTSSVEDAGHRYPPNCMAEVTPSDLIYGRLQCSGTPDETLQVAAYGVG